MNDEFISRLIEGGRGFQVLNIWSVAKFRLRIASHNISLDEVFIPSVDLFVGSEDPDCWNDHPIVDNEWNNTICIVRSNNPFVDIVNLKILLFLLVH